MHQSARSFLLRSISLSLLRCSSTQLPQFPIKLLFSISNPCSSLPKPYFSPSQFSRPFALTINPTVPNPHILRGFCSNQSIDYGKEIDEINLKFAEAREEIDAALDSKTTVYFDEEAECAREVVKYVFDMFEGLLERDRSPLQRSMRLSSSCLMIDQSVFTEHDA